MAMKKDDDKSKRTLSGKKPSTFGGANSKLIKPKPTALTSSGPRAEPSRPMGRDATGEANFDRTPRTRATVSLGPATLSMGDKKSKSTGGMDMSKGAVKPKSSVNPAAKMNFTTKKPYANPTNQAQYNANVAFKEKRMRRQGRTAYGVGGLGTLAALNFSGDNNYVKQGAKWIKDTPIRKEAKRVQKAENDAMIVERKAKAEAKNPSTPVVKVKASKSTMKNIKRLKKGQ